MKKTLLLPWIMVCLSLGLFSLGQAQVSLPFWEDFEGGSPATTFTTNQVVINGLAGTGYAWSYNKTLEGRLRMRAWQDWGVTTPFTTSGNHAITLDDTVGNTIVSVNDLILTINMSNYTGSQVIEMDFNFAHHGEEPHANDRVFIRGSITSAWITLYNLNANQPAVGVWANVKGLDLDSVLSANSQSFSATTQIRFGQQDDFGADDATFSDGYSFDDVKIYQLSDASAAAFAVTSPMSGCGMGLDTICFNYQNVGAMAFDSAMVFYSINGGTPIAELDTSNLNPGDQATYCFAALGNFSVVGNYTLRVWVQAPGDTLPADDTTTIVISNIPLINTFPHFENFESGANGWIAGGMNSSWALTTPANATIQGAASGINSWVTNATGFYNSDENSFVQSPCLDFSTIFNPRICFSIWWNAEFSWDGAALQSSIDGGLTWQLVGTFNGANGDPANWYTDNGIAGNPGGQQMGWSGRASSGDGSNGYVLAQHDLLNLGGQSSVILRVAFGSDGIIEDDGFAFDDVLIFEKPASDASAVAVLSPGSACNLGLDTVRFAYNNTGIAAFDSAMLSFQVDGGTITTEIDTTTLMPGDTAVYTFTGLANLAGVGAHTIKAWVSAPNDQLPFKDTLNITVNNIPEISSFPYLEDFESGPGGWTTGGLASSWQLGLPRATVIDTAASGVKAWMTDTASFYNLNENSFVESPCFDLTSLTLPVMAMNIWWDSDIFDGANIDYSLDGGMSWSILGAFGNPNNWYNKNNLFGFPGGSLEGWGGPPGSGGWVRAERQLPSLAGEPNVRFRINFGEDGFDNTPNGFAFDDFELYQQPPIDGQIIAVTDPLSNCSIGMDTVCISYFNNGSVAFDSAYVSYRINGGTIVTERDTLRLQPGDTVQYCFSTLGNFTAVGSYQVRAWITVPGDIQGSNDTTVTTIQNVVSISSFPHDQDFENGPAGWTSGGVANSWQLGRPVGPTINSAASGVYAWVTDTSGFYNNNENSYVISPCFDFSGLFLPILEVNIWWESETSWDGTVLQSSIDGGQTWANVGKIGDLNWYTDTTIDGNPGGQQHGWTNTVGGISSGGWVRGMQVVRSLSGQPRVRFRFAFGSDGSVNTHDGFAFDDFSIRESPAIDAQTLNVLAPVSGCGLGTEQVGFRYTNGGITAFDSAEVSYSVNGGMTVTEIDPRVINPGDTVIYPFTALYNFSTPGNYNILIVVKVVGDSVNFNDTLRYVVSSVPNISTFPHLEDFESGPGGWTAGGNGKWQWGLPRGSVIGSAASGIKAWMTDTLSNYKNSECSFVLSPCFDFSALSLPLVRANIWVHSEDSWDGTVLQATTDSGLTWTTIGAFGDPFNWYNDPSITGLSGCLGNGPGWTDAIMTGYVSAQHELAFLAGEPDVRFRFFFGSDASVNTYDGFAFDDFEIEDVPPNNVGVVQILSPKTGQCGDSSTVVSVVIRNYGSSDQHTFPIRFDADTGNTSYATINYTYSDTLDPGTLDTVILGTLNTFAGGTFNFTAYSLLANDSDRSNDSTSRLNVIIQPLPLAPIASDTTICGAATVSLSVLVDTQYNYTWYDAATGGNILADSTHLVANISGDTTFFVEARAGTGGSCIRITEAELGATDFVEIQNLSSQPIDATGYVVAVSNSYSDIGLVNTILWNLGNMNGGQILFRDDDPGSAQYWGNNLFFNPGAFPGFAGWVMILDNAGTVVDAVFWGWEASDIASINTTINGYSVTGADIPWTGDGVDVSAMPGSHIELQGNAESNDLTDWNNLQVNSTPGTQSSNLSLPYSCGGGCPSLRTPLRVLIRPFLVNLGQDRAVCEGANINGTTAGAASYLWSTSDTTSSINANVSGQYVLAVTSIDGCVGTDTINLLVQPLPIVNIGPADTAGCGSVLLDAGNPGAQYAWSNGGQAQTQLFTANGTYSVNVTNPSGCTASDTINVNILPEPLVNLGPDVTGCDEATLDAGAFPAGYTFLWNTNATTQTIRVTQTNQYSVTVTDTAGCQGTDDIIVSVLPGPVVNLGGDRTGCDSLVLDAGNFNSYTWSTQATSRRITVKTAGTYSVSVLDNNGCPGADTVAITIEENPRASWSANWTSATDVQFTNTSTPSGAGVSYLWDFGDGGSTSTLANPSHSYATAGNYIVSLTVTTTSCGSDDAERLIGTALEDELFGRSITLFPNPSNGIFALGISGLKAQELHITVSDVTGKTIMEFHEAQRINGNFEQVIDLSGHAEGVYMVTVFDGQRYARKKMIVR